MVAYIATGITVTLAGLSGDLLDVNHGGESCDMEDVTHQLSTEAWREFLSGLKDGGEVTLTIHYAAGSGPDMPAVGDAATSLAIAFPTAPAFSADVFVSGKGFAATLGTKIVQDVTVKITGKPTWG
jgi:hypothetical protein